LAPMALSRLSIPIERPNSSQSASSLRVNQAEVAVTMTSEMRKRRSATGKGERILRVSMLS
jgi:hypothetical protein